MQSRCCWPPERREAGGVQLVLDLVPQRAAAQRLLDAAVHLGLGDLLIEADAEGDVLVDRHRERRRLLEHHADPRAQQIEVELGVEDVGLVQHQLPGGALARIEVVHPVEDAQQRRLAATGRADEGGDAVGAERQVDVLQRMVLAVIEVEVARRHLRCALPAAPPGGRRRSARAHGYGEIGHFAVLSAPRMRAPIFRASTVKVISKAPAPGELLPVGVGALHEVVDGHRQVGHRLGQVEAEELVATAR